MTTLTYGFQLPGNGDKGSVLWTALALNINQLNTHSHNGTDSAKIPVQNFTVTTQTILAAAWSAFGPTGHYRQSVAIPAGFTFDGFVIDFRTAAGARIYPTVEKIDATHYYIYCTDNTLAITAVYGV